MTRWSHRRAIPEPWNICTPWGAPGSTCNSVCTPHWLSRVRVVDVLVAEAVGAPDDDERGRQSRQVGRARGRGVDGDVVGPVEIAEVAAPAELVRVAAPDREALELARRGDLPVAHHRALEQLEAERDLGAIASEQRERGGQPPAGAGPGDPEPLRVDAELVTVLVGPLQAGVAVFQRPGIGRLRREPVLHRHADAGEQRAIAIEAGVVHRVRTEDVAPAVDRVDARQWPVDTLRSVHPHDDVRVGAHHVIGPVHVVGELDRHAEPGFPDRRQELRGERERRRSFHERHELRVENDCVH